MRARSIGVLPWPSASPYSPRNIPIGLDRAKGVRWYWGVQYWNFNISTFLGGFAFLVGSGIIGWNRRNNVDNPGISAPINEQELPIGWNMDPPNFPPGHPLETSVSISFFSGALSTFGGPGYGAQYTPYPGGIFPFLSIATTGGQTDPLGTSAVHCDIDGETIGWDDFGLGLTGTVSMQPLSFWTYLKADFTNPIYDLSFGTELRDPHQTDELFSST